VIGEIVEVLLQENYLSDDGYIDIEKADSTAVSGLDSYHSVQRIDRFSYAQPDTELTSIWNKRT
jgi:hypothetical protein